MFDQLMIRARKKKAEIEMIVYDETGYLLIRDNQEEPL